MTMQRGHMQDGPLFPAGQALGLFLLAAVLLVLASPLIPAIGVAGILLAQVVAIGGVPAIAARLRFGSAAQAALGLRRPDARALAGAACIGLSFWYLNLWLTAPLAEWLGDQGELAYLEALVADAPFALVLVVMAVAPAVCEELLLRGVVARSLRPGLGRAGAILASAALFALLHFSLARLLPTATFGVILAYATLTTGSVIPSMLMHALNNTIALTLAAGKLPGIAESMRAQPAMFLVGSLAICTVGVTLIRPPAQDPE